MPRETPNHVGIFTRSSGDSIFEVSALTRNGDAKESIDHPEFRTSVISVSDGFTCIVRSDQKEIHPEPQVTFRNDEEKSD